MEKKNVDPGWNDPPMLNYSSSNPPPKSRITNKRVAFPLSGGSLNVSAQTLPSGSTPKLPPSSSLPPPCTSMFPIEPPRQESNLSPEEVFKAVKENFDKLLLDNSPQINKESIQLVYKNWEEGIFSINCQNYIYLFSKHLVENNQTDAQQLQAKLLLEFKDSCEEWLGGIKI